MADYTISGVQPYTYIDTNNRLVEGYRVYFVITAYGETHYVTVPNLNPETVKAAIAAVVNQRQALAKLG